MNLPYAYTPQIWPPAFTALVLIALAVYSFRRRSVPGALPFSIALLFSVLWAAGSAMEYATVDLAAKITWVKFQTVWQLPAATAVTCFVLEYVWPGRWLNRRNLVLLSIVPIFLILAILTDDLHHLIWRGFSNWNGSVIPQLGSLGWTAFIYSFGLVLLTFIAFGWLILRSPQHRWPVAIMIAGNVGARILFVLDKAALLRTAVPIDILGIAYMSLMYAIALFGFRFLNPVPLARQTVIEQLRDGMIVLDPQGLVTSLNPAAEQILQTPAKIAKGRFVRDLLPAYLEGMPEIPEETEIEFTLAIEKGQSGSPMRYCTLESSTLKDWRGMEAGYLLLLRDVTSRKQAEAALNESREIQRLIYEKSFDGISIYEELPNEDKRILVDCNERYCQMAGCSKAELLAIQDTRLIQWSEHLTEDSDRAAVMAGRAFSGVFSWIRPDGKENFIEYNAAPIRVGDRFFTIGVDRDITERRHTQAQILEHQRALATLHEREHLARELHDSTSQVLGYAGFQLEAISTHLHNGQAAMTASQWSGVSNHLEEALAQLLRLGRIVEEAQADLREYILNLRLAPSGGQPFITTLRQYLDGYNLNYEIQAELSVGPGVGDDTFSYGTQLQLFRIIQEALSNARKHSSARSVQVTVQLQGQLAHLGIQDKGCGFDPTLLSVGGKNHFGLHSMRERAEQIGGSLRVVSAPGQGTCVMVDVPVKG